MNRTFATSLIVALLSAGATACSSGVRFVGSDQEIYSPKGTELCWATRLGINKPTVWGQVSEQDARELILEGIAASGTGMVVVDHSQSPDVVLDFMINDATECVHCPEDYNYLDWTLVLSDARDHRYIASFGRSGWKLVSNDRKALGKGLRSLRSKC